MSEAKLKNAPLKEVVFELFWECPISNEGIQQDYGFDLAQGRFADKLKNQFPTHKKLIPDNAKLRVFGAPLHQYWKGELIWPVVQHGRGMIAVNETEKNYKWKDSFENLVFETVKKIIESYDRKLSFNKVKLQYIDAVDVDQESPYEFMSTKLQTSINTKYQNPGELTGMNIQQTFKILDDSLMTINIANGINNQNGKSSVIWTTSVERKSKSMQYEDIKAWTIQAHNETSKTFKNMLNKDYYASLDK